MAYTRCYVLYFAVRLAQRDAFGLRPPFVFGGQSIAHNVSGVVAVEQKEKNKQNKKHDL